MSETKNNYKAIILDMDGVVTQTAMLHAEAWKQMFDGFLKERDENNFQPLVINKDYKQYIDGIPRFDGVRNFLASRQIEIPEGHYEDSIDEETVYGLGNRKNVIFRELVETKGAHVYDDALEMLEKWSKAGIKLAIISSSRNCKYIIESAGLSELFDARVDGQTLSEEGTKGKPEPDIFLKACEILNVTPQEAMILEDSIAGISAGKKGGFAQVVGVARNGEEREQVDAGADRIVKELTELKL
ncbi:beta-phosphoglucomutase family hydrolase [Algoriphagus sp. AGSA1]|uniref:beta-phosphoglucomutase family hydrolase n=1 Tax=Algoriphagus sp. AGSA1 TaxID=2907213 RepID=UPI001F365ABB|nr:beta-phosphoglucomutase family hydrolase [Algoriphagus sp. AGSA1]MCE7056421.1 beta-phosphoglucomutase family hydrolase [Algoriphagus sp. AGSA1]